MTSVERGVAGVPVAWGAKGGAGGEHGFLSRRMGPLCFLRTCADGRFSVVCTWRTFFLLFFFRPWATVNSGFMLLRTEVLGRVLSVIAVMALAEERGEKPKW